MNKRHALVALATILAGIAGAVAWSATANADTYSCSGYECGPDHGPDPGTPEDCNSYEPVGPCEPTTTTTTEPPATTVPPTTSTPPTTVVEVPVDLIPPIVIEIDREDLVDELERIVPPARISFTG